MSNRISAFTNDALGTLDAVGVTVAIGKGEVSVEEVTEAAINRAEKVNPALNAIVLKTYDDARNISGLNKDGMLYGVPAFIKDNENLKGYPTQRGTGAYEALTEKKHSKYTRQFLSTGINCLGKSTLPEFGFICSTENERWGITRNPWDTDYTTGGSSSGSAALVASGAVPIAVANDGAGSTRIPASCCGLVGLKPTRNRLMPLHGTETLPVQIVYNGVLTRSVRDTAAFYASAEQYYYNRRLPRMGLVQAPVARRLKFAFFENQPEGRQGHMDEDTWRVQIETAQLLESLGHKVEMVKVPVEIEPLTEHYLIYYGFLSFMTNRFGKFTVGGKVDQSLIEPFTRGLMQTFAQNKGKLPGSIRALKKAAQESEEELQKDYDVVMTCVTTRTTPPIGYFAPTLSYEEIAKRAAYFATYLPLFNISGSPGISLPMGTASNGMPVGVQFATPYGQDKLLLELAYELEIAKPWKLVCDV